MRPTLKPGRDPIFLELDREILAEEAELRRRMERSTPAALPKVEQTLALTAEQRAAAGQRLKAGRLASAAKRATTMDQTASTTNQRR